MLVSDSEAMREFERVLIGEGHHGFTVMPAVAGSGRHGLHTGDRIHPGASSLLLAVVAKSDAPAMLELLRKTRDEAGGAGARIWTFDVDEVA